MGARGHALQHLIEMKTFSKSSGRRKHVTVFGAGNIGSWAIELLARLPEVGRLTLVDPDVYSAENLPGQRVSVCELSQPKVEVAARAVRGFRPDLKVETFRERLEDVPLGHLDCDLMLACLDSKLARMGANQAAWRLGLPLVDAGVAPDGMLVRVSLFFPAASQPCFECAWDDRDYATLEVKRPCAQQENTLNPGRRKRARNSKEPGGTAWATRAPACLGSLAASLAVIQCAQFLRGGKEQFAAGHQIVFDAASRRLYDSELRCNPKCRFDHKTWEIRRLGVGPREMTLEEALALGDRQGRKPKPESRQGAPVLRVGSKLFLRKLVCVCGAEKRLLKLEGRLSATQSRCRRCGGLLVPLGTSSSPWLTIRDMDEANGETATRAAGREYRLAGVITSAERRLPLARLGFRPGDVFSLCVGAHEQHWALAYRSGRPLLGTLLPSR